MSLVPSIFLNPLLWPLLLFALLPLVLHVLERRRARRIVWPAVRFFLAPGRRRLRWIEMREGLLIALRSLAALLVAYALLRPAEEIEADGLGPSPQRRGVVFALDVSHSMAHQPPDGVAALADAVSRAAEVAGGLREDDPVIVLTTGVSRSGEIVLLSPHAARRKLLGLAPRAGTFHLAPALDEAIAAASRLAAPVREVYVFSDFQAGSSARDDPSRWDVLAARLRDLTPLPALTLVACGSPERANRAVASLTCDELLATTGTEIGFRVRVTAGAPGLPLAMRVTDNGRHVQTLEAAPAEIEVSHRFSAPGAHEVSVEIDSDGFPADDARHLVLEVHERVEVLIVEGPPTSVSALPRGTSARHVDLALLPPGTTTADAALLARLPFRPRRSAAASAGDVAGARVVVLADVPLVSDEEARVLDEHVTRGGGLIVFAGPHVDPARYNALLYRGGSGPLPAALTTRVRGAAAAPLRPAALDLGHPALAAFREPAHGDLGRVEVTSCWRTEPPPSTTSVLARLGSDLPWILERRHGAGRVFLVTTLAGVEDSTLPRTPLVVPLVHLLVKVAATGEEASRQDLVGDEVELALARPEGLRSARIEEPDGSSREIAADSGRLRLRFDGAPGFYKLHLLYDDGERVERSFAANLPAEESRLERTPDADLAAIAGALGARLVLDAAESLRPRSRARVTTEHWPSVVGAAVLLLVAELAVLRGFARGRAAWRPERRQADQRSR